LYVFNGSPSTANVAVHILDEHGNNLAGVAIPGSAPASTYPGQTGATTVPIAAANTLKLNWVVPQDSPEGGPNVSHTVTVNGKSVALDGSGSAVPFGFSIDQAAASTTVVISDTNGNPIRTMDSGARNAGLVKLTWDGKNDAGVRQNPGPYTVTVTAKTQAGAPIPVTQNGKGRVSAISFAKGYPEIQLDNGLAVPVSDLLDVSAPLVTTTTTTP